MIGFNADQEEWVHAMASFDLTARDDFRIYVNPNGSVTYIRVQGFGNAYEFVMHAYCRTPIGYTVWASQRVDSMMLLRQPAWVLEECFKQLRQKVEHML